MTNMKQSGLALIKKDTVDIVAERVRQFQENGELYFPANYSAENAMKSAWLALQETKDKNSKPVLEVCTKDSIANSLLDMVVQGLTPAKKQCYFIAYGKQLTLHRSYFGTMAVAKRVRPTITDIYADVVYVGDEFEYEKVHGKTVITKHIQKLENVKKENIIAAYCTVLEGEKESSDIMTIDQIKQAWKQSKMNPVTDKGVISASSVHGKFTEEMCKKTVINRTCKPIINASDDGSLLIKTIKKAEQDIEYAAVNDEIEQNANVIEINDYDVDIDSGEVMNDENIVGDEDDHEMTEEADCGY
ncbi:MAG: RecT family recombinase [Oscillospiraceae bacterium]